MKKFLSAATILGVSLVLGACNTKEEAKENNKETVSGEITVVTNRVDADELYEKIETAFKEKYPEVTDIKWEASGTDYDQYIATRMNTTDYGDVVFIPFSMAGTPDEYSKYFDSLGTVEAMEKDYIDVTEADYDGTVYGLPTVLNSLGLIYNQEVFDEAGIKELPTSTDELIAAAKQIKEKTGAIPFYTNYQRLAVWAGALSSYGGEDFKSATLEKGTAFEEGQPIREVMDLIYELSANGLIEPDPVTLEGQQAQQQLADGKIAMLMSGSQDVAPIQALTETKDTIKIMPFPVLLDGKTSLALGAPSVIGINKNTKNEATAKAFLEFFISPESGFAEDMGGMTPVKAELNAEEKTLVEENNVILTAPAASAEVDTTYSAIANEAGVARLTDALQKVVNIGLYPDQNESYEDYVNSLEAKWETAAKNHEE
ncbi:ABC transporter substrate-binding protein [Enterococcus sp. BWR-S5]|uniref:ABC transporter substrate-binding protein n=1 Tax=Enterococcus sp. BWR-S5 TaxID=2787714 RepID=UPI001921C1DC|nr:ABC transporter substrate-binding protein [Enterococcus sp. BWR-S5]MBL1225570.1 carbohydrate ABC transporter substrate-binding protein [Enterococcus sp. BWR-S5]